MKDALGDRMKLYESAESGRRVMPRGLRRPFDERLHGLMVDVTGALVEIEPIRAFGTGIDGKMF